MKYRYFRRSEGRLYKVQTTNPDSALGNTYSFDGGHTWHSAMFHLNDMLSDQESWGSEPTPVEYFPDTEQPSYRYFRQGKGEWKVQTADPESHEGNFYRNAETPWLSASHSLSDLLAMGATEVGASEEQVPSWAVATVFARPDGGNTHRLEIHRADTEEQAVGLFMAKLYADNPRALVQKPLVERVS